MNKGGRPKVSLTQRQRSICCMPLLIWSKCRVPKGSAGELHWVSIAWRLLDQMEFDRADPCFFWPCGFRGSAAKLCCLLPPIMRHVLRSMVKSENEWHRSWVFEDWQKRFESLWRWGTFFMIRDLWQRHRQVGATVQEKYVVQSCRVKIQGLALVSCAWQWPCWTHCFVSGDFLQGWKPKVYDRATMALVHCFLLGGIAFGEAGLLVLSWLG
jgi:hypothetical protein